MLLTLLHIVLISGLAWLLWRKEMPTLRQIFWPAIVVKLAAGACLGLLYTYYFPVGDTFVYFNDASRVADLARQDLWSYLELLFSDRHVDALSLRFREPRALFLTKLTSLVNLLTGDNYWVSGLYFSLISFLGAWYLVRTIATYIPSVRSAAAVAFLFFPSIVFWTSGLLKESLAMAALFFIAALFLRLWFDRKADLWTFVVGAVAMVVLWNLKYYYIGVLVPVVLTDFLYRSIVRKSTSASVGLRALIWMVIFLLPLVIISFLHPNFNLDRISGVIVSNNSAYSELSDTGDYIHFDDLRATPLSIFANAPWALVSGLFRPWPWEAQTSAQVVAAVENTILIFLFAAALLRVKKLLTCTHRLLLGSIIVFVALSCVLITISAPNFGTLSRYRVGYLAFFVFLILCDHPVMEYLERSYRRLVNR